MENINLTEKEKEQISKFRAEPTTLEDVVNILGDFISNENIIHTCKCLVKLSDLNPNQAKYFWNFKIKEPNIVRFDCLLQNNHGSNAMFLRTFFITDITKDTLSAITGLSINIFGT